MYAFIGISVYLLSNDVSSKWKIAFYYSLIGSLIMVLSTCWHLLNMAVTIGFDFYNGISWLYPYDTLILGALFSFLCIRVFYWARKNHDMSYVEKTSAKPLKKRSIVAFFFMASFASYFLGGFLYFFTLFGDESFAYNFFWIIPMWLTFLLLAFLFMMYFVYYFANEDKKRKIWLNTIISSYIVGVILVIWIIIGYIVNPYFVAQSISGMFPYGYAIKAPYGMLISLIGFFILVIISHCFYIKRNKKVKDE